MANALSEGEGIMSMGQWTEPSADVVDRLTRFACFAADTAHLEAARTGVSSVRTPGGYTQGLTDAELTAVGVRAAIRMLLANGLIEASLPSETEPVDVILDPPEGYRG